MTTRKEKLLQKLNPNLLKMTPKLSGGSGTVIDLSSDGDSLEEGARKLMLRFLKNQDLSERNKKNQTDIEVTVSSAKYNENEEICEVVSEKLTYTHLKDPDDINSDRPGRKLQLLKMELMNKMSAKWEEEYKKRLNDSKSNRESGKSKKKDFEENCVSEESCEEDFEEETKDKDENKEKTAEEDADDENDIKGDDDDEKDVDENADDENDMEDDADDENDSEADDEEDKVTDVAEDKCDNEDEFDSGDGCSLVPAYQPGGGLLYGGSDLTQTEEGLPDDLLLPSLQLTATQSPNSKVPSLDSSELKSKESGEEADQSFGFREKLFQDSQKANDSFDLSDAFAFCSGKFPEPDANLKSQNNPAGEDSIFDEKYSIDDTENKSGEEEKEEENEDEDDEAKEENNENDEDEEEEEDSESEEDPEESTTPKVRKNILLLEDSEPEETIDQPEEQDDVPAGKILSDSEDEENAKDSTKKKKRRILHFSDDEDESNNQEESDSSDEDENPEGEDCDQRSINYDSEENEIINPKEFFEKEAELSGSEWSGDEDERGLDEFDLEDGDADVLDNDQVRSQLEKIHIRRVLDDDAREVRLIQEILFEDGDLHSDGKGRDRKFKWKNLGAFDNKENEIQNKDEQGNSSEDDNADEEEWRKLRHQKELFLMELKKKENLNSDDEIVEENFQFLKVTTKNSLKVSVTKERTVNSLTISTDLVKPPICNARGSFLTRNEEFLSRLAKVSSAVNENVLAPNHSKNYLFLTKSPKKEDSEPAAACKRQVEELESSLERKKKMKLLPREIDTGPSILDLLM